MQRKIIQSLKIGNTKQTQTVDYSKSKTGWKTWAMKHFGEQSFEKSGVYQLLIITLA